ncbi:MAG: helix-turn-helix transcriptional regulator [Pseudonocardiaceae bacterium]
MSELADLLTGPAARDALARRDIAAVFRILRDAGVSQVRIARATGQRESEVSVIVSGRQVQSVAVLERMADGLGVPRGWLGLAFSAGLDPEPEPSARRRALAEAQIRARMMNQASTVLAAMWGMPPSGPTVRIHAKAESTPVPSRVGTADVTRVAATTERLGRLVDGLGGNPVTDALTAHSRASEALLGATMSDPVRQRLLIALSDAHSAAGGAASRAGLRDLAREHFSRSMKCACAGDDRRRAVLNLSYLGSLELPAEPSEALKFYRLGEATAPTRLIRAVLQYRCASALGMLGLAEDALRELRWAAESFEAASEEPRPWKGFATALSHIEGRTHLALGCFDRAAEGFAAATEAASHAVTCTVSNSGLLAAAQLRCGELRAGLATAGQVITLARGLRSVSMWEGLAPLRQAAAARRDSACQDVARELTRLCAAA